MYGFTFNSDVVSHIPLQQEHGPLHVLLGTVASTLHFIHPCLLQELHALRPFGLGSTKYRTETAPRLFGSVKAIFFQCKRRVFCVLFFPPQLHLAPWRQAAAMNPVNATALYVSACRSVLQCDPRDEESLAEVCKLVSFFRQSLSCLVCGNLLQDPIAPTDSTCQHYVCKGCKGKKMMMKPLCSWCRDYDLFKENKQLAILVECYGKLCEFIAASPLGHRVASAAQECPEISAALRQVAPAAEDRPDEPRIPVSPSPSCSQMPSAPAAEGGACPEASAEPRDPPAAEARAGLPSPDGLDSRSGLSLDELAASVPSPQSVPASAGATPEGAATEGPPDVQPTAVRDAAAPGEELCTEGIDICGLSEDGKRDSSPLLLSVEEVLRTLEEDSAVTAGGPSGPFADSRPPPEPPEPKAAAPRPPPPCPPPAAPYSAATPRTPRPNRKRSRSESDSEKLQPLPIASLIHGPPAATAATAMVRLEPGVPAQPMAAVPNGGAPNASKVLLVSGKGVKKSPDLVAKKAYAKGKTKDKAKDRLPGNNLPPGSPAKAAHKKPPEKKGCKCGRATQNPSVLTCRGQRCPCYSNRKACLDCICRGCQNSYMANGEKKLEAFAVPEKALEQTRLTLGINVTSIAVRSAGTSGGVLNVAAGTPVTSLLTASSHEDKALGETLDMKL
ncbi:E3 ubiquitin-protein ligase MSL2a [Megalops cyprinoides]|uniref:E3 ubiquitin-protein ligase MSL2a n=1 Tax=Megalops cyprinoides TaxID=118141 RepID=UPI0018650660|nr:E3 ubiquitin-protein ligase MSL2a [Megalops cyprinoides]